MRSRFSPVVVYTVVCLLATFSVASDAVKMEKVIVLSSGPRQELKEKVEALGGHINFQLQNVNAASAVVPASAIPILKATPGFKVGRSAMVANPRPVDLHGEGSGVVRLQARDKMTLDVDALVKNARTLPADYSFNNALIHASSLQAEGILGQGVVVAVIDSGVANNPNVVPALDGSVIGGESFVPAADDPVTSATSTKNDDHGTWVSTMIAAHVLFIFPSDACFVQSLQANAPDSVIDGSVFNLPPGLSVVPMVGVAPAASIYALKVFPSSGGGAPEDTIIAAMDRAITLKKNFLGGMPSVPVSGDGTEDNPFVYDSLNIQVVNMSLGGPTLEAGRDVEDLLTLEMLKVGIVLATSAGNAGPAGLTVGSPATGFGSISSAASLVPAHERILADLPSQANPSVCRVGRGLIFHPTDFIQTAFFSSRGPSADGRAVVDVTTPGFFNFVEGADGGLSFVAGTSFSAPTVSGAAALLRSAITDASATRIRNSIIAGANPKVLGDRSTRLDQGMGFLDISKSLALLQAHKVAGTLPPPPPFFGDVALNIKKFGIPTFPLNANSSLKFKANNLLPGQRSEFVVKVGKNVGRVDILVQNVTPKNPPQQQNQLFGDDLILSTHQAKTSAFGEGDYPIFGFVNSSVLASVDNPEPGYMRIGLTGDWTNAGKVSGELIVSATRRNRPAFSAQGTVGEGDFVPFTFSVPSGKKVVSFELTWTNDWSHYPTNDLDLLVVDPDGNLLIDGATLNGREVVHVDNPAAGTWQMFVNGFTVFGGSDSFRVTANVN
jgi:subtilisin family serine protease